MRKASVCHLTTVHPVFDTRIFHKECRTLSEMDYDVSLIAQNDKDEVVDNIRIIALKSGKNRIHRMLVLTTKACWLALKQKANIYHFHDVELIPVGIVLKMLGKKVIYDVHEDNSKTVLAKYYIPKYLRKLISRTVSVLERCAAHLFDYIVCAGDDIADNVFGSLRHKLVVLRNVPLLEFVESCFTGTTRKDWIVYIGAISEGRGLREIVEAMNYVGSEKAKLILIGICHRPEFERELRSNANKKVEFIGVVPFRSIPHYIRKAKIGLICFHPLPNMVGALSGRNNKIYEYMAGGLAIIVSNLPGWAKIIEETNIGITVESKNPREIAKAIDYLLSNPAKAKQMGQNGRMAVTEKFNWDIEKEKLLQIYTKLSTRKA